MSAEVVMPQMGEPITEGTVSKWLKSVGDKIEKDEPILEISTDKVDAEVPSPGAGILLPPQPRLFEPDPPPRQRLGQLPRAELR